MSWRKLDLGEYCHWCGAAVSYGHGPRTGKHLFCRNKGKCKMAHVRAYAKYLRRVTPTSTPGGDVASSSGANGNALGKPPIRPRAGEIPLPRAEKGNARKARKR